MHDIFFFQISLIRKIHQHFSHARQAYCRFYKSSEMHSIDDGTLQYNLHHSIQQTQLCHIYIYD